MSRLAEQSLFWGFLSMTFIGAGLHINARLCGNGKIGSEANASLVAFGWFGVNLLGVGLHSYGFTDSIAMNLAVFILFELWFGLAFYFLIKDTVMKKI